MRADPGETLIPTTRGAATIAPIREADDDDAVDDDDDDDGGAVGSAIVLAAGIARTCVVLVAR